MLSLDVYAIGSRQRHILRREMCSIKTVPSRCLAIPNVNGHEYINLMPFFFVGNACWRFGAGKLIQNK